MKKKFSYSEGMKREVGERVGGGRGKSGGKNFPLNWLLIATTYLKNNIARAVFLHYPETPPT